jgi:hypothetical protein
MADLLHRSCDQPAVTMFADGTTKPEAGRGLHREGDPDDGPLPLDSQFVGLNFSEFARLPHEMLMHLSALSSGTLLPVRDSACIKAEGGDDSLGWTAPGQQGDDPDDPLLLMAQAIEGRALRLSESPAALLALVTPVAAAVDDNVASTLVACGRTIRVRAECSLRVHARALSVLLLAKRNRKSLRGTLVLSKIYASTL